MLRRLAASTSSAVACRVAAALPLAGGVTSAGTVGSGVVASASSTSNGMQSVCVRAYLNAADMALLVALSAESIASPIVRTTIADPSTAHRKVNSPVRVTE